MHGPTVHVPYDVDFRRASFNYGCAPASGSCKRALANMPTLPANAKVKSLGESGLVWEIEDKVGAIENMDLHIIDKGVAYV